MAVRSSTKVTKELLDAPEVPAVAPRARRVPAAKEEVPPSRVAAAMSVLRKKARLPEPVYPVSAIGDVAEDISADRADDDAETVDADRRGKRSNAR